MATRTVTPDLNATSGQHTESAPLSELLGPAETAILVALGDQLFPADDAEPSVIDSGAYTYLARRLTADAALLAAYRRGAQAAVRELGEAPADERLRSWLRGALQPPDDLPTGLSGSLSPEAIEAGKDEPRMFALIFWQHLREGMFCDPRHGGNRDGIMWRWLGYNGPQLHGYTETELLENALPARPMRFATDWAGIRD